MTKEQLDRIYGINTVSEPVQKKSSLTEETLDSIYNGTYKANIKTKQKTVGAEQYNSAPTNAVEPKELVKDNTDKLDTWLDYSYKLSKEEEKEAKDYIKQWRKENNAFKNNPYKTQEGTRNLQKIAELESKLSGGTAAWAGFTDAIPFLGDIQDKISNAFGNKNTKEVLNKDREVLEAAKIQSPVAAQVGNIAGEIAKYSAGTELLTGAGLLGEGGKITQGVSKVIKNPKVAGSVANIFGDTSVDVALDTIPHLLEDISKGEENAGANALKNIGTNLAFNTLGEGAGIVAGKAFDGIKNHWGKAKSLNPLEDAGDTVQKIVDGTKKNNYSLSQIVNDVSQKADDEIFDPVEKAFKDPNVGLTHTPEQLNQMKEYYNSTDEGIIKFVNEVRSKDKNTFTKPYELKNVTNRAAEDIKRLTGIEAVDNKILLNKDTIFHIDDGHGKNGVSDKSMADDKTLSRIQYILDNYEGVFLGEGTTKTRLKDGSFAPTVAFYKKVDGNYFVVEAVTDAKSKKNMIVSAYCSNKDVDTIKKEMYQAGNVNNLPRTSETHPELISNNIVPKLEESVNGIQKGNVNSMVDVGVSTPAPTSKNASNMVSFNNTIPSSSDNVNAGNGSILNREGLEFRKLDPKNNEKTILYDATEKKVKERVSKVRSNTLENSGINTAEELSNKYLNENNFKYTEKSEKETMQIAVNRLQENPQKWYENLMASSTYTASDIDTMMMIYRQTVENARMTNDEELWKEAGKIYKKIQVAGTKGGQLIQSLSKWRNNTAEGIVANVLSDTEMQLKKKFGDKKTQVIVDELTENIQKDIYELAEIAQRSGLESKEGKEALAKMGKIINANTPKTLGNVITTTLMDNMLLNFRTLISRNALGNLGYNAMEFVRQPVTALIDRGASKFTGKRTRTGWNADKMLSAVGGLGKGLKDELVDIRSGLHTSRSGESIIVSDNFAKEWGLKNNNPTLSAIEANAHAYKGKNYLSNALNKVDDITKHMLSIGDRPFYEAAYKQRYIELMDLRKKELLDPELMKLSDDEFKNYAELAAKTDGLMATYQDDGPIAEALLSLKEGTGKFSEGTLGGDILSQVVMPFTKTPGNIASRSLEYSPFGIIKNTANTIGEVRKGEFNQQRFVDELGRNILGTGLFAGGIAAYDNGLMTGSYSDDKDMKNAQKNSGMQEFAWKTNRDGKEGNYEISWIPVLGNNLVMAAAAKEAFDKNKGEDVLKAIGAGASTSADALLNTSTLQGMNRLFGGNASYSTENNLYDNAVNALTSGLGQVIPSSLRQAAQSTDKYERELSEGDRKYWQNSLINSIPVLREKMLQPKIDNEGNVVLQNQGRGLGSRLVENMLSPGKYTEINNSPVNAESMRLFESTGNNVSFLPTAIRKDITDDDFIPTDAQYRQYRQKLGKYNSKLAGKLIDSDFYQKLSDEDKESALQEIYKGMKALAKEEVMGGEATENKIANLYRTGNSQAVIDYMQKKYDFDNLGVSMSSKKAQEAYAKDGLSGLKDYSKYSKAVDSLGLTVNNKTQSLYEAGGIPYLQQYSEYKTNADTSGNGKLTKSEVVSYLDSTGLSQAEKRYWFSVLSTANNPY